MHNAGLLGKRPKEKYHSYKGDLGKIDANIINRDFSTTAPFQKWTTDISQFNFSRGKCYLPPILDMHTMRKSIPKWMSPVKYRETSICVD